MRSILSFFLLTLPMAFTAQTIQELQGDGASTPYENEVVTTSGVVTAADGSGFFLQDGTGPRSGVYVFDGENPALGMNVTVTGTIVEFYGMTEITNVTDIAVTTGGSVPPPELLSTADVNDEDWEGVLVRVEGAECTNSDLGFGEWEVNDGSGPVAIDDLFYGYTPDLGNLYAVTGPQMYAFGAYKIVPRNAGDVSIDAPLYFTKLPEEFDMTTTGMVIRWETNAPSDTQLEWGFTPTYEQASLTNADLVTEHEMFIDGLTASTVIYFQAKSVNGDGETAWYQRVAITTSNSSGDIEVLFTQEPDLSLATVSEAKWTASIADSIASYISIAEVTLDIAMYDLMDCDPIIIEAINDRVDAGVIVRYITDEEPENTALDLMNPEVPVLAGNTEGIMHDKFILIDRDHALNSWVITGSTNHTGANLGWDYNNHLRIHDRSLAVAYTLEFEEMWGSDGNSFDLDNSAFASEKTDNTPHKFIIGGRDVELYFSPSDGTTGKIAEQIGEATERMAFAVMAFTENSLGNAVAAADAALGDVQGVIDYVEFSGSEFDFLVGEGVDVVDYQNEDGSVWPDGPVMHSKYAICDYHSGDDDPVTITGSHNWTASAGSINDENTLIIHDAEIANWFYQDFMGIRNYLGAVNVAMNQRMDLKVYPNPAEDQIHVTSPFDGYLTVTDISGKIVLVQDSPEGEISLDVSTLRAGRYIVKITDGNLLGSAALIIR